MAAWQRSPGWMVLALLIPVGTLKAEAIPAGRPLPLAVRNGRCELVLPTTSPDDKFYLLVGSLARGAGPFPVTIASTATTEPISLPLEQPQPDAAWEKTVQETRERLARAQLNQESAETYHPAGQPPKQRIFYLFTRENDFQDADNYVAVTGELRAVGQRCQVYVDRDHQDKVGLQPTVAEVVRTFDEEVYPRACRTLGRSLDVDRDGRFTILFTGWLGKLVNGKVSLGGFVRGSDFYRDLPAPYGNQCDMMYLNTDLKPGPYLRTLLAHEYTHAVLFSEHIFGSYLAEASRQDEEGWLNEALAHLAEDMNGYCWDNLDYRISAYLSAPERYQLVVNDYYGAGLWRSHGNRGATYLFLRWCADRQGADFAGRLIRTNLLGTRNLEVTMQQPFADLFRQWSAALVLSGTNLADDKQDPPAGLYAPLRRLDLHQPLGGRLLCGLRLDPLPLAEGRQELHLGGTTVAALLLHSPHGDRSRVTVIADPAAALQVTLIRLPEQTARLTLRHEIVDDAGRAIRLVLTANDAAVTLQGAAWERLVPASNRPEDTSYRQETPADLLSRTWFGDRTLKAGETRISSTIRLPEGAANNPLVFKVAVTDAAGHHLAAWDLVSQPASLSPAPIVDALHRP